MEVDKPFTKAAVEPINWKKLLMLFFAIAGPGIVVMLADTEAGSIITAAQSGAQFRYMLILPQLILIPVLYLVQEITVRLGVATNRGHGDLIREKFGMTWAVISVCTLFLASVGALVTEFVGIAGVGELFNIPKWVSVIVATAVLILIGMTGSYKRFERIAIAIGLLELLFIPAAFLAKPDPGQIVSGLATIPWANKDYIYLVGANIGAVVMPWMIFYQQGAVIDKGLKKKHLKTLRGDTLIGAILTQIIVVAVVLVMAATVGKVSPNRPLNDITQIAQGLQPFLGASVSKVTFGIGMLGASFIGALVVSVAGAWGIGEAFGFKHSLNHKVKDARLFYFIYTSAHVLGAVLVLTSFNLINLSIDVEVMNALLLPIVLGLLLALEAKVLPPEWRMRGFRKYASWAASGLIVLFSIYMTSVSIF